jgi:hypothetical protein
MAVAWADAGGIALPGLSVPDERSGPQNHSGPAPRPALKRARHQTTTSTVPRPYQGALETHRVAKRSRLDGETCPHGGASALKRAEIAAKAARAPAPSATDRNQPSTSEKG